jgi:hypothetical protein
MRKAAMNEMIANTVTKIGENSRRKALAASTVRIDNRPSAAEAVTPAAPTPARTFSKSEYMLLALFLDLIAVVMMRLSDKKDYYNQ